MLSYDCVNGNWREAASSSLRRFSFLQTPPGYSVDIYSFDDRTSFYLICSSPDGSERVLSETDFSLAQGKGEDWINSLPLPRTSLIY